MKNMQIIHIALDECLIKITPGISRDNVLL